ncbi:MAG TPA: RQC domain-containing protein, partial [Burkholderiales bacterium]
QRFGAVHLIDVLRGRATDRVSQWKHDGLSVFGIGGDIDEAGWRSVFRQLVAMGYARPDHDAYGALRLTESARPVLKGGQRVEMRRAAARGIKARVARPAASATAVHDVDADLLAQLKQWRAGEARLQSVPAYVVFHDSTLAAIAAARPQDLDALSAIAGIGVKKLERYGPALLALLRP